jgi:hypothetical protein
MSDVRDRVMRAIEFNPERARITLRRDDVRDLAEDEAKACAAAESWEREATYFRNLAISRDKEISALTAPRDTMPRWLKIALAVIIISAVAYGSFLIGLGQSAAIPLP